MSCETRDFGYPIQVVLDRTYYSADKKSRDQLRLFTYPPTTAGALSVRNPANAASNGKQVTQGVRLMSATSVNSVGKSEVSKEAGSWWTLGICWNNPKQLLKSMDGGGGWTDCTVHLTQITGNTAIIFECCNA